MTNPGELEESEPRTPRRKIGRWVLLAVLLGGGWKGGSTREAKRVCLTCDVRGDCLEYALANDERFGIWGGMSERERRKLKKRAV